MTASSPSSQGLLKSPLTIFYRSLLNSTSNTGIPALLGLTISGLIWSYIPEVHVAPGSTYLEGLLALASEPHLWLVFAICAFLDLTVEEAEDRVDVVIKYIRVSSEPQDKKSGKERQDNTLLAEIERLDPDRVIDVSDDWESAATMLRANIDEIIDIVQRYPDQTVCLMLEDIDRLSRAEPFETATFLWILTQHDVLCYFDSVGYFDFSDPDQQLMAFFGVYQSRQEYNKIAERTDEGQRDEKSKGRFPAQAPYGFVKRDNDNTLYLDEQEASVIQEAASLLLSSDRSFVDIYQELENEYSDSEVRVISQQQFKRKFTDPKYVGKLLHKGEHVGDCPQILSEEQFEELSQRFESDKPSSANKQLDHALTSVIDRFGIDASLELFDVIKGRCPDCGGDVETWGSEERWGHRVLRYRCVEKQDTDFEEDEMGCGFQGPLLTGEFLRRLQSTVPVLCPICRTPADEDDWEPDPAAINAIQQTCDECGVTFSLSVADDRFERGFDLPDYAIDLLAANDDDGEEDVGEDVANKDNSESTQQKGLRDFG